uniref:Thaumatin-like protein n=1 Tax=Physcomitrium patens TaxID=3218 RepID=A0A2K1K385_PHYPA|nr:thaumatin-like protein 1 [Physcomitrium patens]PNR48240.1 hypothetical protein PHYPA_012715 [Physcomitrium patens]|eukprot:XP_024385492.1 thaumatin-like protein 1 [Physcomitrella patens]
MATGWTASLLLMLIGVSLLAKISDGATINLVNQCTEAIVSCAQAGSGTINCYPLAAGGGSQTLDVASSWQAGVIWAYPGTDTSVANTAKPQANLAEFTIGGSGGKDYYDLSNVNAYNLAQTISMTSIVSGDSAGTQHCTDVTCSIADLNSFCQSPNTLTGDPGDGCYNTDGPGTASTAGTQEFKTACSDAYSYSTDDSSSTWTCGTSSNYQVTYCP